MSKLRLILLLDVYFSIFIKCRLVRFLDSGRHIFCPARFFFSLRRCTRNALLYQRCFSKLFFIYFIEINVSKELIKTYKSAESLKNNREKEGKEIGLRTSISRTMNTNIKKQEKRRCSRKRRRSSRINWSLSRKVKNEILEFRKEATL